MIMTLAYTKPDQQLQAACCVGPPNGGTHV